jgi:hypothetical protein
MATLSTYIAEVRRLLHDANSNFWTDADLTTYINEARERVVRDTGCLRTLQSTYTPLAPNGTAATLWAAGATVTTGQFLYSSIFIYQVITGGVLGSDAPAYPSATEALPPSTNFTNGTATLLYVQNVEIMPFSSLPNAAYTLDILNVTILWGNSRIPLRYLPWTQFNAEMRYWQNNIGRPVAFSIYGQQQIFLSPVPDQSYNVEVDTVIMPQPMSLGSDVDTILAPYTQPVQFYAAYKAKYQEQSYGEAEIFKQEYIKHVSAVLNSVYTRRIPNPYSTPY